jgi:hypothetical protein
MAPRLLSAAGSASFLEALPCQLGRGATVCTGKPVKMGIAVLFALTSGQAPHEGEVHLQ